MVLFSGGGLLFTIESDSAVVEMDANENALVMME